METNLSSLLPDSYRMPLRNPYFRHRRSLEKKSEAIPHYAKASHLAKQLGLCSRTLFRWAAAGKITRYKINARVVLFSRQEVIDAAKRRPVSPSADVETVSKVTANLQSRSNVG